MDKNKSTIETKSFVQNFITSTFSEVLFQDLNKKSKFDKLTKFW